MTRTLISEITQNINKKVILKGWVQNLRRHGKISFFDLKDRSVLVQVVSELPADFKPQDIVKVCGIVKKRPAKMINANLKTGSLEISAQEIKVLVKAQELPFDMGGPELKLELPNLLDYRSLSLRHPKISAIFKVQAVILKTFRETLNKLGFTEISVPTIVATATEGGSEVFSVDYFGKKAYLAQSPQFFKQIMVGVFERVYTVAHAYRAEPSVTTRHIAEYVGLDAEMGFIDNWQEIVNTADQVVKSIFKAVQTECGEVLKLYKTNVPKTIAKTPQIKLKEALTIIYKRTGRDHRKEPDLDPEDEREICRWAEEEKGSEIVFITHYPTKKRPMYTMPDSKNPQVTLSFDLIGRGVEWITGSQRINDYQKLVENIKKWGCDPKDFSNPYLQAFEYGMPAEGGFCMGLERITQNILNLANIREATLFPRDLTRIDIRLTQK